MNTRSLGAIGMMAVMASLGGGYGGFRRPRGEKYPGQFSAFRQGAWAGDGVKGPITRQMRRHPLRREGGTL